LENRRQQSNESLQEFCDELEIMAALGHPGLAADKREAAVTLPAFLDGMADQKLSFEVWKQKPKTLSDALKEALRLEVWMKLRQMRNRGEDRNCVATRLEAVQDVEASETGEWHRNNQRWDNDRPVIARAVNEATDTDSALAVSDRQTRDENKQLSDRHDQLCRENEQLRQHLQSCQAQQQKEPPTPQQVPSDPSLKTCQLAGSSKTRIGRT
jgi:hypothetical protein